MEGSYQAKYVIYWATLRWLTRRDVGQATQIDVLSDDVLLAIFDLCVDSDESDRHADQDLIYVCY